MSRMLRVAVADDEPEMLEYYRTILPALGHAVVVGAGAGQELVDGCHRERPDLIITDIKMPDMSGIDAAALVCRDRPVPVILVSGHHDAALVERAAASHVHAYLVKPVRQRELEAAIKLAMPLFEQLRTLRCETAELEQALGDRTSIERATDVLMKKASLDELEAFRRLHDLASEEDRQLVEVARMLLDADTVLQEPEHAQAASFGPRQTDAYRFGAVLSHARAAAEGRRRVPLDQGEGDRRGLGDLQAGR